jgi:putative Ca2+/H+ antiporter (TMEM165/GDT1 family)
MRASSLLTLIGEMTYLLRASLRWLFSLVLILIGVLYVLFWPDRLAVLVRSIWIDVKLLASLIHTRVESALAFAVSYVRTFWRL